MKGANNIWECETYGTWERCLRIQWLGYQLWPKHLLTSHELWARWEFRCTITQSPSNKFQMMIYVHICTTCGLPWHTNGWALCLI